MQCSSCHTAVQPDWQFCPKCGQTINSELRFHVLETAIQLALLGADWKSLCSHLFPTAGVSEQEVADGISLRLKKATSQKSKISKSFIPPETTQQKSGPITAQTVFIPARNEYGDGVRAQVFEVIVRQALAGAPWREICAGPMQVNSISELEVQREVNRRRDAGGEPSAPAGTRKPKTPSGWQPGVVAKPKAEVAQKETELPPQMKRLVSVRDALIKLASSSTSETRSQAELKHMVRQLTVDIDGVLKTMFEQPNHATGTGGSQGGANPPGGPLLNTNDGE